MLYIRKCTTNRTDQNRTDHSTERKPSKKKGKVLPSDNSPDRTDYPRETESGEKKGKVLPSDNNIPNRIEYPRETESGKKKKQRFCLQVTTAK